MSRITSSIGVAEAILAETEKKRRGSRPGSVRGSIGSEVVEWKEKVEGCGGVISAELHLHDINCTSTLLEFRQQ